jgi:hypothetical protein
MKTTEKVIAFLFSASVLAGCSSQQTTAQLMKDQKKKEEIITALCEDPQLSAEVAEHMAKNPACIQTLTANNGLIRQITSEGNLTAMLKSDTSTTYNLMADLIAVSGRDSVATVRIAGLIMTNEPVRSAVKEMMHEKGKAKEKKHKEHKDKEKHKKGKHSK